MVILNQSPYPIEYSAAAEANQGRNQRRFLSISLAANARVGIRLNSLAVWRGIAHWGEAQSA